ncbi:histone-like nucleoid-structuring protein Lsr2 [Nostocoides australiense]|uniref:Protein lsr2 n=1 Tax=Nostocoides australiense Ben110 TaxID=1193182 RepID=W6JSI7_9MICO|nr:Lsr2 family protein [Tetrasphaera australiensis]MCA0290668.1 Lsr2 family protein [Actinomycetota bacterium]MCB1301170.1 Lsr2 family protein [Tetrasphaera sp.]CCH71908.1 Protein lsr2 [Tetrasphaera australiensis Ben110]HPF80558.1 Lsr2 family protein [Tetrasphaera australiensis]HRW01491.1 Lsr2 family protein [Tetrasphaera sp.]
MAQRVQVMLIDDVDQTEASETVSFGLDGVTYEIDLSEGNAGKLRDDLARWIGHARRTGGRKAAGTRAVGKADLAKVREWARENGHQVSDRGRISAVVQEAYQKAHG